MNSAKKSLYQKEPSLRLVKDLDDSAHRLGLLCDEIKRMQDIVEMLENKVALVAPDLKRFNRVNDSLKLAQMIQLDLDETKTKALLMESIVREYSARINDLECIYYYKLVKK